VGADQLSFGATPILVDDTLYLSTPTNIVIALDAATGKHRWRYDPEIPRNVRYPQATSRGVSWWTDEAAEADAPCTQRIFTGTLDARLIAIDASTGRPCADFGDQGSVALTTALTSPPAIYQDLVIVGSTVGDSSDGIVRALDARSGQQRWSWGSRGVNAWSIMSVDVGRGLIFVPTGSTGSETNNFGSALVALRAATGELAWSRQLVHQDVWGYDLAAQPMLIDIEREGKAISAVVQATRTGMLFVFDRESGEPVFEIVERPVPQSNVPGEQPSPTQPFPATPTLVSHAAITPQDAWGLTMFDRASCRKLIARYRSDGLFTPPSLRGTIMPSGSAGGVNWGSLAFDSERQLIVAAVNHAPMVETLIPRERFEPMSKSERYRDSEFDERGGAPYGLRRELLTSPLGMPCTAPPWGSLAAVDLRRNAIRWQVVLGSTRDRTPWFVPSRTIGMPNQGGPMLTTGGLVFIGAATDNYLRAFAIESGREVWKGRLPAGGQATPMTYESAGRQFVVIAAGGHGGLDTKRGDYVIAFALPPTE
jgi:quinoprotein glucose dehydrogenase